MIGEKRGRPCWNKNAPKSVSGNGQRRRRKKSASVARRKRKRLGRSSARRRRSEGAESAKRNRKKTRNVDERRGNVLKKRKRKNVHESRKRGKNTRLLVRLALRRFARKTVRGRSVLRLS